MGSIRRMEMPEYRNKQVIGRMRGHLSRADWQRAPIHEVEEALRDIKALERRIRDHGIEMSESVVALRETLIKQKKERGGGGFRRAAGLL